MAAIGQAEVGPGGGGTMTAAEILAALVTVDGPGSGLDADSVDGISGAGMTRIIGFTIDGDGSVLTTGAKKAYVTVPFAGTIVAWTLLADQAGDVVVDVWKDVLANFPPTVADTITAAAKPTLSAASSGTSSTLTGWTTAVAAGDVLEVNVDSVATITKLVLQLKVVPT
jgi:hypothetical protein